MKQQKLHVEGGTVKTRQPLIQRQLEQAEARIKRRLRHGAVKPDGFEVGVIRVGNEQNPHVGYVYHSGMCQSEERGAWGGRVASAEEK